MSQCPNRNFKWDGNTRYPHAWYAHIVFLGIPLVRKCKFCSAKRIF